MFFDEPAYAYLYRKGGETVGKNDKYVVMDGSKELGMVSAMSARNLYEKLVKLLAAEYMKRSKIRLVRCN